MVEGKISSRRCFFSRTFDALDEAKTNMLGKKVRRCFLGTVMLYMKQIHAFGEKKLCAVSEVGKEAMVVLDWNKREENSN